MISIPDVSLVDLLWCILLIFYAGTTAWWLVIAQRALEILPSESRMPPKNVWLTFIPLFGLYWQFEVVKVIGDAMGKEYIRRGIIPREPRPGFSSGLSANILLLCAIIPNFGILVALISNITRIIHLSKIRSYTMELEKIMSVQTELPQVDFQNEMLKNVAPSIEEQLEKNNPNRFLPPMTEEEEKKRWGRK